MANTNIFSITSWKPADLVSTSNISLTGSVPLFVDGVQAGSTTILNATLGTNDTVLNTTSEVKIASKFSAPYNSTATSVVVNMYASGSPTGNFRLLIIGDANGIPDLTNVIATSSYIASSTLTGSYAAITFNGFSASLSVGVSYWISIEGDSTYYSGIAGSNFIVIGATTISASSVPFYCQQYNSSNVWVPAPTLFIPFTMNSGVSLTRLLLTGQTTSSANGLYNYSDNGTTYTLVRSNDGVNSFDFINAKTIQISSGEIYSGSSWSLSAPNTIVLGTTALTFRNITTQGTEGVSSCIWLSQPNGHGTTLTAVRRFALVLKNTGSALTYTDSASNGGSITVNTPGIYTVSGGDDGSNAGHFDALTVNWTTSNGDGAAAGGTTSLLASNANVAGGPTWMSYTGSFNAGDVIRLSNEGNSDNAYPYSTILQVTLIRAFKN